MTLDFVFKTATGHDIGYWLDRGYLDMYSSYANGDDPGKGILTANWNHFPRQAASDSHRTAEGKAAQEFNWSRNPKGGARFQDILERMGYKLEWSDQTSRCDHCYGAVLEGPDYYGDSAHAAVLGDCSLVCESCIRKDFTEEYLEGLENKSKSAVNIQGIDPAKNGYVKVEGDFENGFHPGQTDNPKDICKRLEAQGYSRLLFVIDSAGQFDISFSVWCHSSGLPKMADYQRTFSETAY